MSNQESLNKKQIISVIVPCFNEQESINSFDAAISELIAKEDNYLFEIIYVDDGSKDNTLTVIKDLKSDVYDVRFVSFSRNFGKEAAMLAGLKASKGDFVSVMDVDLQDPVSMLIEMIRKMETNSCDCVAARRVTRKGEPVIRSFFARQFYKFINKHSETEIVDGARDFRLMKRKMVDSILQVTEHNRFSKGIFSWVGYKTIWLEYENVKRLKGTTKWSFFKLFKYSINGTIAFSSFLLNIIMITGFILLLLAVINVTVLIVLINVISNPPTQTLIITSTMLFLSGLLSVNIGLQNLYVSKIYDQVKNRPLFIVKESDDEKDI